jgi:hypothetical protein
VIRMVGVDSGAANVGHTSRRASLKCRCSGEGEGWFGRGGKLLRTQV